MTCGQGQRVRTRTCTQPAPRDGGERCAGNDTETGVCSLRPCPGEPPRIANRAERRRAATTGSEKRRGD